MKRGTKKKEGLALLTTLLILGLLLGLMAAFLVVNRAGNRFTVSSVERRSAQDICLTAFYCAYYHLERERSWGDGQGKPESTVNETVTYPLESPQVKMVLTQEDGVPILTAEGVYSQRGNFDEPEGTFTMTIVNNLWNRDCYPDELEVRAPARSVRVEVVANVGGVKRELSTLLRTNPISHDGLAAGSNVYLDDTSGLVRVESRDPYVNRIRAGNDMELPSENNVQFLKHGIAASSGRLTVGGTDLAAASDDVLRDAGEASGGMYAPNAAAPHFEEFDPEKITLPANVTNIPPGTWVFGDITGVEYRAHTLEYEVNGGPGDPDTADTVRYQRRTSVYNQLTSPTGEVYVAELAIEGSLSDWDPPEPPSSGVYEDYGEASDYGYGDTSDATDFKGKDVHEIADGFKANVTTAQMIVLPSYALKSSGDFIVEAEGDRLPELYFGYDLTDGGVATQLSMADGEEAAQENPAQYMAGIIADEDVNVTGGVLGYGSMIAGGDLTIKASSGLRVAPDLGVVVKGNRVIINPATEPEPEFPGEPVSQDYPVFREAISAQVGSDWSQYEGWLEHDQPTRDAIIESLSEVSTGDTPTALWNALCDEIGKTLPEPNFVADHGWPSGPATVEQYVRLKEFLQTQASGYNGGEGDPTWLDLGKRQEDAAGRVAGTLNGIAQWAKSFKESFQAFLTNPEQSPPDMFLEGLVYADEDILIDATGKSIRLEGAVVAQRDLSITSPSRVDIVYSRELLDDLTEADGTGPVKLEKVFFTLE